MTIKFKALLKILDRYGISERQGSKATHFILSKEIEGTKQIVTIAVHNNEVYDKYVSLIREKFQLKRKHGVSDREFYGK